LISNEPYGFEKLLDFFFLGVKKLYFPIIVPVWEEFTLSRFEVIVSNWLFLVLEDFFR